MGLSVKNQCDSKQYFSLSTISKEAMKLAGLNITMKELKSMARNTTPCMVITTGDTNVRGYFKQTNVYRYADFVKKSV